MASKKDVKDVQKIVRRCCAFLHGHPPEIQGAALADLLAMWLAGHDPSIREDVLAYHIKHMRPLIAVNDPRNIKKKDH